MLLDHVASQMIISLVLAATMVAHVRSFVRVLGPMVNKGLLGIGFVSTSLLLAFVPANVEVD